MTDHERLCLLHKMFTDRAKFWENYHDIATAYRNCASILEYAVEGNDECLEQFDYLGSTVEEPADIDSDVGYDPYLGCTTDDC